MILFYQNIYKNFSCIADKCKDSCCKVWEVSIDEEFKKRTQKINNSFSRKMLNNIICQGKGDFVFKDKNGKCPFLNDNNLCDIIISLSDSYLPKTCKIYPRFIRSYGSRKEFGLSLSCPEVTRLFMENDFSIISEVNLDEIELTDIDAQKFIKLYTQREKMLKCESLESKDFNFSCLNEFDYINSFIPNLLKNSDKKIRNADSSLILKLYKYFSFKYYLDSLNEDNMKDFILFNTMAIKYLIEYSSECESKIIQQYCKETEHCQDNIDIIKRYLKTIR